VRLKATQPARTRIFKVQVQNRSAQPQTIADATTLGQLVRLAVTSRGACPDARVRLHQGKPQKGLPLTLRSKQKVNVFFDVVLDCVSDSATGAGHEDLSLLATVDQTAHGGTDMYAADDVCPRRVSPPVRLPFPDGSIMEKGCGARQPDQTFGGPVLIDLSAF